MPFPETRMRRLRSSETLRSMVRETRLSPEQLVYPLFACMGNKVRKEVKSMPGVFNLSVDECVKEARAAKSLGIPAVILFGLPESKDEIASGAWAEDGIVQRATRAIKSEVKDLLVIADVCLCEYTSHGHCGVVKRSGEASQDAGSSGRPSIVPPKMVPLPAHTYAQAAVEEKKPAHVAAGDYEIVNDATLDLLSKTAVSLAQAGADIIAPSDMMDGRVSAIREALDEAELSNTPILSYAAKFASAFYGPFREAADSAPQFGDRHTYQMDGANVRQAMREIELDIEEGADIIMVKPALPYLDVIAAARQR